MTDCFNFAKKFKVRTWVFKCEFMFFSSTNMTVCADVIKYSLIWSVCCLNFWTLLNKYTRRSSDIFHEKSLSFSHLFQCHSFSCATKIRFNCFPQIYFRIFIAILRKKNEDYLVKEEIGFENKWETKVLTNFLECVHLKYIGWGSFFRVVKWD